MTYPPQPMHPSQYPDPQQAYAQQYPQQPAAPAPAQFVMPNVVEPTGGSGGGDWAPNPRHLIGYAAIILPTAYDPNNPGPGGTGVRAQVTCDFVVVGVAPDGSPLPPIEYGDNQSRNLSEQRPNCFRLEQFPAEFRGARWTNSEIVKTLAPLVGTGSVSMGRFRIGDQGNRPPLLEVMAPDDAARQALAQAWQQRTQNPGSLKRSPGQGITEINGGPPQKDAAPQQAPQGYPQQAQPGYGGHQWGGPPPPPMPPQPGYPQGAQVAYPPPPQPGGAPMPPQAAAAGWTQAAWDAAPPPVRAQFGG